MAATSTTSTVLDSALAMVAGTDVIALDLETTSLDPRDGKIRLVQLSNGERTFVLDLFKDLDPGPLFEALKDKTVIVHGGDFEWRWIYHHYGVELENIRDTFLLARLAACGDMSVRCGLGEVAERELDLDLDKEMQLADWSGELTTRHLSYAALDAQVLIPLYKILMETVEETEQGKVAEIEFACLPAVALMKYVGMPIDKEAWYARAEEAEKDLRALEKRMLDAPWMPERPPVPQTWAMQGEDCLAMLRAAGVAATGTTAKDLKDHASAPIVAALLEYRKAKGEAREAARDRVLEHAPDKPPIAAPPWNFGSWQQVVEISYEILGFEIESTEEGTLLRYKDRHPFFEHMLEHRRLKKLVSTYGKTWFQKAYHDGRVYPAWWQIGTSTGRFASGEKGVAPNAQNLPGDYRKFFVAPEGRTFVAADYSQIEARILGKMLGEETLIGIYDRGEDVYRNTAASMLAVDVAHVTDEQRDLAKALMLGMSYGMSARGLPFYAFTSFGLSMSIKEAEEYVRAFYDLYPKIETYHKEVLAELRDMSGVDQRTLSGRLRADITNRNEAINAPVQGTAADGLKLAMAKVYRRLKKFGGTAFIVATIHDELLVECDEGDAAEVAEVVETSMVEAMDEILNAEEPRMAIKVDVTPGKHWSK